MFWGSPRTVDEPEGQLQALGETLGAGPVAMAATQATTDTATSDTSGTTPLFTMRLPEFGVRQRLWPALTGPVAGRAIPQYPVELRDRHVNGEALLRFVVEPTGSIDLRTVEVMKSTHVLFTRAVLEALPQQQFHPLVIGPGCPVHAADEMPFVFTLN